LKKESVIYGVLLCFILTIGSIFIADLLGNILIKLNVVPPNSASPISGIFIAIIIGIIIRNTIGLHDIFMPGITFSLKFILRAGIVLLGLRLSLMEAVKLGAWGLPIIVICILVGLLVALYFTKKLNISKKLGTLIAGGTGICGVTAIMVLSPVIKAKDDEVSYAVANITVFGLIGMLFYPYLGHFLFAGDPVKIGLFLGTSIHDTAQVTGASLMYSQMYQMDQVVDIATVTKLTRNLFIIVIIPLISYLFYKQDVSKEVVTKPKWYIFIPLFVLGFIVMTIIRTIGDMTESASGKAYQLFSPEVWEGIYSIGSSIGSTYFLGIAMAAVGLSTNLKMFKGLGMKPFYIGLITALTVGIVSALLVSLFGQFITI